MYVFVDVGTCKELYTNSKSQLIKLFEKHETYRVPDILAFVEKGIRLTKICTC
jgi:hypothetical protein